MKKFIVLSMVLAMLYSCGPKPIQLFTKKKSDIQLKGVSDHTFMQVDQELLSQLKTNKLLKLSIDIPYKDGVLTLDLDKTEIFAPDFTINTSAEYDKLVYDPGVYYTGTVRGENKSFVSISIVGSEISGVISTEKLGNLNMGKSAPGEYIVYVQSSKDSVKFDCNTESVPTDSTFERLKSEMIQKMKTEVLTQAVVTPCLSIDYELTYEVFTHFENSATASINWATSMFAGVHALFLKENINVMIASFYVHQTEDGYSDNTGEALKQFRTKRYGDPAFKGNFHQLIRGMTGGSLSGIAYVGATCIPQYAFSVAEPLFNFNPTINAEGLPSFGWSIEVLTHELGHNMGSPHTQSCTWPGGAIDGCVAQEGTCAKGPLPPPNGGTIMSYCHLTSIGINFALGFGPLPGAKIREFSAMTCYMSACIITPTPVTPTCTDGIQNQGETGIDCGGPCAPCVVVPTPTETIISRNKDITQSTLYDPLPNTNPGYYGPKKANDGNLNTFNHTLDELNPWVEIDLGKTYDISKIEIVNRKDCCGTRLNHFWFVVDGVKQFENIGGIQNGASVTLIKPLIGRYVRLQAQNDVKNWLHIAELNVYSKNTAPCKDTTIIYKVTRYKMMPYTADSAVVKCL